MLSKRTSETGAINYIKRNYNIFTKGEIIRDLVQNTNFNYKKAMRIYGDAQEEIKAQSNNHKNRETFKFDTSNLWRKNE